MDASAGWGWQPVCHVAAICGRADEEEADTRTPGCGWAQFSREQQSRLGEMLGIGDQLDMDELLFKKVRVHPPQLEDPLGMWYVLEARN